MQATVVVEATTLGTVMVKVGKAMVEVMVFVTEGAVRVVTPVVQAEVVVDCARVLVVVEVAVVVTVAEAVAVDVRVCVDAA